jgi:hypothetical protein
MTTRRFGLAAGLVAVAMAWPARGDDPKARSVAEEVTAVGAKAMEGRDLDGMMATYDAPAKVSIFLREGDGTLKEQPYEGYEAIRGLYASLFEKDSPIKAKNEVDEARFLGADFLLITGTFEATQDGKTSRFPFVQLRRKVGESWRVARMQVYAFELN